MQLIFEAKSTEEIKMSMQAETPISKDIMNDMKERNLANEENKRNIDDETIVILQKSASNKPETEIDHLPSVPTASAGAIPREINTNGHENIKCDQGTDSLHENDLLENIKSANTMSESTNMYCRKDEMESENPNGESATSENLLAIKNTNSIYSLSDNYIKRICSSQVKQELGSENFIVENKNAEIVTDDKSDTSNKNGKLILSQENLLKVESKLKGEIIINVSHNEESFKTINDSETVTMQEIKPLMETDTLNILNTTNIEKSSCFVGKESDANKEDQKNVISTKDMSSSEKIIEEGSILKKIEIKTDDNGLQETDNKPHSDSENEINKLAAKVITFETEKLETTNDGHPEVMATVHILNNSSEVRVENSITLNDEKKKLADDKILKIDKVSSIDIENQDDIAMHIEEGLYSSHNENSIKSDSQKLNSFTLNEHEVAPIIEKISKSEIKSSAKNDRISQNSNILEHSSTSVIEEAHDMSEPTNTNYETPAATKKEKAVDAEILENNENTIQESIGSVVCAQKKENTKVFDEKEHDCMEIDGAEIVDIEMKKSDESINKTEISSDGFLSMETNLSEIQDQNIVNKNEIERPVEESVKNIDVKLKEVETVPMETDDVEIVDLEKGKHDENIGKMENISNITNNEGKLSVKTEPHPTSAKITNKEIAEPTIVNPIKEPKMIDGNKLSQKEQDKVEILEEDDIKIVEDKEGETLSNSKEEEKSFETTKTLPVVCKLSNTLDILSDDEEELSKENTIETDNRDEEKQCINIDDDDDIMLIDEDSNSKDATKEDKTEILNEKEETQPKLNDKIDLEINEKNTATTDIMESTPIGNDSSLVDSSNTNLDSVPQVVDTEKQRESTEMKKPLLPQNFLKTAKKNLAEMTRHELEDFCILRIVESIVDRSSLCDIKAKMKTMAQNLDDFRKRAMMLTKQNRDLQVVLKSVQEEQKKRTKTSIQPLKITRSVGMQVLMNDKIDNRRKGPIPNQVSAVPSGRPARVVQAKNKPPGTPTTIPVPRKVPVNNSPAKTVTSTSTNNMGSKTTSPSPNGLRNPSPVQKAPEKRTHSRMQATSSFTVDLTDDEPPPKVNNKNVPIPPVRVVPPQNLLAQQRPFAQPLNSPRKVYIPISGPQGQPIRPGQTLMMRSGPSPGPRQRLPSPRLQQTPIRINKQAVQRHPAPLPDVTTKQYTPSSWKSLPPAPDLKLSKVENGIVISWKIDAQETDYETIVSYQLYAYQETTAPPNTTLWKKIGDVKALPLPMACTLTQFMAGFKYYFAVRAVDIRSRVGPFSLPGSILLLNKL